MRTALHFAEDGDEKTACGERIVLCDEYTDDKSHVDCERCKRTTKFKEYDPTRYDVDVWNFEGDVIAYARAVKADQVEELRNHYNGEPVEVVVTER